MNASTVDSLSGNSWPGAQTRGQARYYLKQVVRSTERNSLKYLKYGRWTETGDDAGCRVEAVDDRLSKKKH